MKLALFALAVLLCLAVPGMAMNLTESAYMKGLNDGYSLGHLAITGQSNATAEQEYNSMVARLNAWMDTIGYEGQRWANLTQIMEGYQLPEDLR
jgi:hypothetical protein